VLGAADAARSLERVTASIDVLRPDAPKRVLIVASNPAVSETTGWPIGFWWAELTHPYWELTERGYRVDVASPDGGRLEADSWSDPRDESGYSADDLLSLGFINSPEHAKLVEQSIALADVSIADYDAVLLVGGQGPMYTFARDERVARLLAAFYEAGKVTAVICHATCVLLTTRLSDGCWWRARPGPVSPTRRSSSQTTTSARGSSRSGSRTKRAGSTIRTSSSTAASSPKR
jgi:putative intracellular protease/amidase